MDGLKPREYLSYCFVASVVVVTVSALLGITTCVIIGSVCVLASIGLMIVET